MGLKVRRQIQVLSLHVPAFEYSQHWQYDQFQAFQLSHLIDDKLQMVICLSCLTYHLTINLVYFLHNHLIV